MGQNKWAWGCALIVTATLVATQLAANEPIIPPAKQVEAIQPPRDRVAEAERRIEAFLDEPLKSPLDFAATPLNQVIEAISSDSDLSIVFDTTALDAIAASPETEVTINITQASLRSALELMLKQVDDLTYIVDNEVLLITTEEEAARRLVTSVYRVDDLLLVDPSQSVLDENLDYDSLINLVVSSVEHESWMEAGTGEGEILPFRPGMIIVSQTARVHRQIERLLAEIRRTKAAILADHPTLSDGAPRAVTRSINYYDQSLSESEKARSTLEHALQKSVDWKVEGSELASDEVFLHVLPRHVLVRHSPAIVNQIEQIVHQVSPSPGGGGRRTANKGAKGGGMGGGGGF